MWPVVRLRGIVLVGALMAFAACGRAPATAPPAYSTTKACVGANSSASADYSLKCPQGWTVTTSPTTPDVIRFASRSQMANMEVSSPVGRITADQYGTLLQARMRAVGATNVTITARNTPTRLGANTWMMTATGTGRWGTTNYTLRQYVTIHNGARYLVMVYAPTTSAAGTENALRAMLASLTFH